MARICLLLVTGLMLSAARPAEPTSPDVYILAGQSNMSGRGLLEDLTAAERIADPAIRLYGNDGAWHAALDPLDSAADQVDAISADAQAAVGPGLFFAREMRRLNGRPVVMVSCARGGTSIGRWKPGGGRDTLYGSCLARAREVGGHLAGLLWYQGESDAEKAESSASAWRGSFRALVAAFREDLASPSLPVVFVRIADRPERNNGAAKYPNWQTIQDQQAQTTMKCATSVSASGLGRREDELHLTTAAQRELGPRLAAAMVGLTPRCRG